MLILTRTPGASIIVGDNVAIVVLGIEGAQVRLGIRAPTDVPVHREEVYRRIHEGVEEGDSVESSDLRVKPPVFVPADATTIPVTVRRKYFRPAKT